MKHRRRFAVLPEVGATQENVMRLFGSRQFMKNGWFRLWVVLSSVLVVGVLFVSAYYVLGKEACYTFVSVSIADNARQEDQQLAKAIRKEATERIFCGTTEYSPVLTLEGLAKRGAVTQVGVSWLEPNGWSFKDHDMLDVLESNEIKTTEIMSRVSSYVRSARLRHVAWFVAAAFFASLAILILGLAVGWVRRGFQSGGA